MNKDKLKNKISKLSNGDNYLSAQLYQMFFFEQFLKRLSISPYRSNFILKGGLLMSSIVGKSERTTKDLDATLKGISLNKETVINIISNIISIDIDDGITFELIDVKDIREVDIYGGYRVNMYARMQTLRIYISIELTTGDKITPNEIECEYNCLFDNNSIPIFAYTLETIIAEKFHSVVVREGANTRMKDFYDIYILIKQKGKEIDFEILAEAIKNTFNHRSTNLDYSKIKESLQDLKENKILLNQWLKYQKSNTYANSITYDDLFDTLKLILGLLK